MGHAFQHTLMDALTRRRRMQGYASAVAARHGPRRHRDAERRRARAAQRGHQPARPRPRGVRRAGVGVEGRVRRQDPRPDARGSASASTGPASASRWTRGSPARSARSSAGSTTTASSTAPSASSTGARAASPRCPTSRSSTRTTTASSCRSGTATASSVVVATTRPETMLGDTAVAVHPDDERYARWSARRSTLPLVGREIPVVADEHVDPEFGTGAVKVTPGARPQRLRDRDRGTTCRWSTILDERGAERQRPGPFGGLDRFAAREAVREALRRRGADRRGAAAVRARRRPLPALRHGRRAAAVAAVVRQGRAAGRGGRRGGARRPDAVRAAGCWEKTLLPLAREHPRLVHLAPALVGPPHPGLVLRGRRTRSCAPDDPTACAECGATS